MAWVSSWWLKELRDDPAYAHVVTPLMVEILAPHPGATYLDLGCGEGQTMRALEGVTVIGCDYEPDLLERAYLEGPVVRCDLPDLSWMRDSAVDGAYASLVIEHVADAERLFAEVHRVVKPGGVLAAVLNHPLFASPASGPVVDPEDGELFWRWGRYLTEGTVTELVDGGTITFYHRSMSALLNAAAGAGWVLNRLIERSTEHPVGQEEIPRLLAVRWRKA